MSEHWMSCESRAPWVTNSLAHRAKELRSNEANCRIAFRKPWMGEPAAYLADVYKEAAELFEGKLAEINRAKQEWDAAARSPAIHEE